MRTLARATVYSVCGLVAAWLMIVPLVFLGVELYWMVTRFSHAPQTIWSRLTARPLPYEIKVILFGSLVPSLIAVIGGWLQLRKKRKGADRPLEQEAKRSP